MRTGNVFFFLFLFYFFIILFYFVSSPKYLELAILVLNSPLNSISHNCFTYTSPLPPYHIQLYFFRFFSLLLLFYIHFLNQHYYYASVASLLEMYLNYLIFFLTMIFCYYQSYYFILPFILVYLFLILSSIGTRFIYLNNRISSKIIFCSIFLSITA